MESNPVPFMKGPYIENGIYSLFNCERICMGGDELFKRLSIGALSKGLKLLFGSYLLFFLGDSISLLSYILL